VPLKSTFEDARMTTIKLQIPPDLLAAVDRFIEEEVPEVSRPDALLAALRAWAVGNGLMLSWRGPQDPPATWPAAANDG
jgi:hypothetical protein